MRLLPRVFILFYLGWDHPSLAAIDAEATLQTHEKVEATCSPAARNGDHVLYTFKVVAAESPVTLEKKEEEEEEEKEEEAKGAALGVDEAPAQGSNLLTSVDTKAYHLHLGHDKHIAGLTEGLEGICPGQQRLIKVSPEQGYSEGSSQSGQLPWIARDLAGLGVDVKTATVYFLVECQTVVTEEHFAIFDALKRKDNPSVQRLIKEGKGITARDEAGNTALMLSVQHKQMDAVAALLNAGGPFVDVNAAKPNGFSALTYATQDESPALLRALLLKGASPNTAVKETGPRQGWTPLHFAAAKEYIEHVELLLEAGADGAAVTARGEGVEDVVHKYSSSFRTKLRAALAAVEHLPRRS